VREDRHGRVLRADTERSRRPSDGFRLRDARRFRQLAEEAVDGLPDALLDAVDDADVLVGEVPPPGAPDRPDEEPPLAAFVPRQGGRPARVTVYRRPVELRAASKGELVELVRLAVGREVARALGLEAEFDDWWDED